MHRPLLLLLGVPSVGGGEAGEQQRRRRQRRVGCSLGGLGAEEQQVQVAQDGRRNGPGDSAARVRAWELQQGGACRALTRPWPRAAREGSRGRSLAPPGARGRLASRPGTAQCPVGSGPGSPPSPASARSLSAELPAQQSYPLLRSGPTDRLERRPPPLRLAPGPPPLSQPNQRRLRGGYQGDAAPRPLGGGAGGRHARFSRQNSKAGRAALLLSPPSRDQRGPDSPGLQLPAYYALALGVEAPTGGAWCDVTCSPCVGERTGKSSVIY